MYTLHISEAKRIELPGRVVFSLVGLDGLQSNQMSFGMGEMPANSKMSPHAHKNEEEIIFITEGFGNIYIGTDIIEHIEPGTVIVAPRNVDHFLENISKSAMKWIWVFNPPVKIGSHTSKSK